MSNTKKVLGLAIAVVALVGVSVMGTVAYLTSTTDEVTNTFSVGNVAITLDETDIDGASGARTSEGNEYHLIPGSSYIKDPTIHIDEDSEDCYVFVKVENGLADIEGTTTILSQMYANNWTLVSGYDNIYQYKSVVTASTDVDVFETLTIKGDVDNETLADYEDAKIVITACAVQAENTSFFIAAQSLPSDFINGTDTSTDASDDTVIVDADVDAT